MTPEGTVAREDQIKRLSSITKLRDEQLYGGEKALNEMGCRFHKIKGINNFIGAKLTDKASLMVAREHQNKRLSSITKLKDELL